MTRDRAELKSWYRQAMLRRIRELRGLRPGLEAGEPTACDEARRIGQALRGSGATFGFPEITEAGALVETSADSEVLRRVEGFITELDRLGSDDEGDGEDGAAKGFRRAEWLFRAAGLDVPEESRIFPGVKEAWAAVSSESRLDRSALATRVADHFGLEVANITARSHAAQRLVPEALMVGGGVVPISEDSVSIVVATSDPTSLDTEIELRRLTGRTPVFVVAPPDAVEVVLAAHDTPARPAPPAPAPRPAGDDLDPAVLVVDDDASARLLLRTLLEKRGYHVVEAEDGLDGLDAVQAGALQLVVADLNMPRMDGLEFMWELRDREGSAHLPVIVVTGEVDEILETQLMEEGADDYIRKPVDPRLFLARVDATIRRMSA